MREPEMKKTAEWIDRVLGSGGKPDICAEVRREVAALCEQFPTRWARVTS